MVGSTSNSMRVKRVTDPLDDKVKARIIGHQLSYVSSGSEHCGENDCDDSPCLSELVHGFLEDDLQESDSKGNDSDSERVEYSFDCSEVVEEIGRLANKCNVDSYGRLLLNHVSRAKEVYSCFGSEKSVLNRKVMSFLRELGHNAAICKTKWNSSGGLSAGCYEFIDVIFSGQVRYFVDLDFSSEFEVVRASSQYARVVQFLPRVFVGKSEELKRIVRITSVAAKKSLKNGGLFLPPWRKNRFMQTKWFGPYRRTTNPVSANPLTAGNIVNCRAVGFDAAVNGSLFVRTR